MADGLLLIHAFPLDSTMWKPQKEALGDSVPIVAPNFPGFGGAALGGSVSTMDAMADSCAEAVRAAGLDRVVVCGLSMGGYAALAFWRRHRPLVAGLVLANTRAGADDDAGKQRRTDLASRLGNEGSGFLVESPPPLLSGDAPATLLDDLRQIIAAQPPEAIAAAALGMRDRPDAAEVLGTIDVPTLVITGSGDTLIPPQASQEMAEGIPGAQFETIPGAGHLSNLEAPDAFNRLLRAHLVRCGVMTG